MKTFDLVAALRGDKVTDGYGRLYGKVANVYPCSNHEVRISVRWDNGSTSSFFILNGSGIPTDGDFLLYMAPKTRKVIHVRWFNVYEDGVSFAYCSQEEADKGNHFQNRIGPAQRHEFVWEVEE
jgi:hypothetical protein